MQAMPLPELKININCSDSLRQPTNDQHNPGEAGGLADAGHDLAWFQDQHQLLRQSSITVQENLPRHPHILLKPISRCDSFSSMSSRRLNWVQIFPMLHRQSLDLVPRVCSSSIWSTTLKFLHFGNIQSTLKIGLRKKILNLATFLASVKRCQIACSWQLTAGAAPTALE